MSTEVIFSIDDSIEELFLFFIDDERNKDIEKKFATYLNEYFNFKEKNDSLSSEREIMKKKLLMNRQMEVFLLKCYLMDLIMLILI